jgi:hypothetical protein
VVDLTPWAPAIAVGGVVLGIFVNSVTGSLTRRQNSALSVAEQKAALRNDRREAIYNFIQAVEKARAVTAQFPAFGPKGEPKGILDDLHALSAEMWARRGCLEVICRPALSAAATEYAQKVEALAMMTIAEGLMSDDYEFKVSTKPDPEMELHNAAEKKFFSEARKELYAPNITD